VFALAGSAGAQGVYRCGSSYGQRPCAGGAEIPVGDARSAADAAQARAVAQADARRADAMEKARLAQAKNAPKALVIGPKEAASAPVRKGIAKKKPKKRGAPENFTAVTPRPAKHP
jgi:hypothetical protein